MELKQVNKKIVFIQTNQTKHRVLFRQIIRLGFFTKHLKNIENIYIFADLNSSMRNFMNDCVTNLIKNPTCFKSAGNTIIDLTLTTNIFSFNKHTPLRKG